MRRKTSPETNETNAIPDIPTWREQIDDAHTQLLAGWMDQERTQAEAKKKELSPEDYRKFCKRQAEKYRQARVRDRKKLREGNGKLPAFVWLLLFEEKIDFYTLEARPTTYNTTGSTKAIVQKLFRDKKLSRPNRTNHDIQKDIAAELNKSFSIVYKYTHNLKV